MTKKRRAKATVVSTPTPVPATVVPSTALVPVGKVRDASKPRSKIRAGLNKAKRFVSKNKIAAIAGGAAAAGAAGAGTLAYGAGKRKGRNQAQSEP